MPAALRQLMWMQLRGAVRRLVRRAKSIRGAVFFLLGLTLVGLWLVQAAFGMAALGRAQGAADPQQLLTWGPAALLLLSLTVVASGNENALTFRPAEIDFLFPAPFTRRQLLIYKLSGRIAAALITALFFSLWLGRYGHEGGFVVAGFWLAVVFVQLLPVALSLAGQSVATAAWSRVRRAVLTGAVVLGAVGLWQALPQDLAGGWQAVITRLRHAPAVEVLLAPFTVFVRAIVAPRFWPDFVGWAAGAVALDGLLVGGILWLDANYYETSLAASRRLHDRIQAVRRGGLPIASATQVSARRRVPNFGWLGGAGPIAWRQATTLVRTSWWLWIVILLAFGAPLVMPMLVRQREATSEQILAAAAVGIGYITLMLTWTLRFDFRAEMARMDWLKMLPLRPAALASGELLVPCATTAFLQSALWSAACLYAHEPAWIAAGVALSLPICGLLFGLENLLFLLFPPQTLAGQALDLQTFGRQFVLAAVKALTWLASTVAVGVPAALAGWLSGSLGVALLVAWVLLLALDACLLAAIAWAFSRFDVSRDLPGQ